MKIIKQLDLFSYKGFKGSRIQVKGVEIKTLEPSNPGILEPYFHLKLFDIDKVYVL